MFLLTALAEDCVARIVFYLFGFVWMEEGKFVGSWQERESEQPLCFSGEGCQLRRKDKSLLKTCSY